MERFGSAALQRIYELTAAGGGPLLQGAQNGLRWWEETGPAITSPLTMGPRQSDAPDPARIYPDATAEGRLAGLTVRATRGRPAPGLLVGGAQEMLRDLVAQTRKIYIFEVYAAAATLGWPRETLWGRKFILSVDNEAACGALTKGTGKNGAARTPVYAMWAAACRCDVAIWIEGVPPKLNSADSPKRGRQLPFVADASAISVFKNVPEKLPHTLAARFATPRGDAVQPVTSR